MMPLSMRMMCACSAVLNCTFLTQYSSCRPSNWTRHHIGDTKEGMRRFTVRGIIMKRSMLCFACLQLWRMHQTKKYAVCGFSIPWMIYRQCSQAYEKTIRIHARRLLLSKLLFTRLSSFVHLSSSMSLLVYCVMPKSEWGFLSRDQPSRSLSPRPRPGK